MSKFETELSRYRIREKPLNVPGHSDWKDLESFVGFCFPDSFKDFIWEAGGYYFEGDIPYVVSEWTEKIRQEHERSENPIPLYLVPFCGVGNGDYHCFRVLDRETAAYDIVYWYHDIARDEQLGSSLRVLAKTFEEWLVSYVQDDF